MIRIAFLTRALPANGAERQLIELIRGMDKSVFDVTVVTFYDGGDFRPELAAVPGVRLVSLRKTGRWDVGGFLWRWIRLARALKPHVIHGYIEGNMLGLVAAKLVGAKAVWALRCSYMDYSKYDRLSWLLIRLDARLSRFADLIIANSSAGMRSHVDQGFYAGRMCVIPNGIDAERFHPDRAAGRALRSEWRIDDAQPLIGIVGRLDPQKDHETFLQAAALLYKRRGDVRFVSVGTGPEPFRQDLLALATRLGIGDVMRWPGAYGDMPSVYNALDICSSSSAYGEGFPNAVAEAMACGVPTVVTDVGDSAFVVGRPECVVPASDPAALADVWQRVLNMTADERRDLLAFCRERIVGEFAPRHLVQRTEAALLDMLGAPPLRVCQDQTQDA